MGSFASLPICGSPVESWLLCRERESEHKAKRSAHVMSRIIAFLYLLGGVARRCLSPLLSFCLDLLPRRLRLIRNSYPCSQRAEQPPRGCAHFPITGTLQPLTRRIRSKLFLQTAVVLLNDAEVVLRTNHCVFAGEEVIK